jgi:hypothetical protein
MFPYTSTLKASLEAHEYLIPYAVTATHGHLNIVLDGDISRALVALGPPPISDLVGNTLSGQDGYGGTTL